MQHFAKISGFSYLMIFICGFYANFTVLEPFVDMDNIANITLNISNFHSEFGYGLIGFFLMLVFDLVLVWSLYNITKEANQNISILASIFRLLHAIGFGVALTYLIKVYRQTSSVSENISIELEQTIQASLQSFDTIWTLGLLFFGVHLAFLGYLSIKYKVIPRTIGFLLLMAALGYLIDSTAKLWFMGYGHYRQIFETGVIMTGILGEMSFAIWLLVKGFFKKI